MPKLKQQKCPWCGERIAPAIESTPYEVPCDETDRDKIVALVEDAGFIADDWIVEQPTSVIRVDVYEHCFARWLVGPNGIIIKTQHIAAVRAQNDGD